MKIHNRGKFHLYSICGCQVMNFQMFSWQCSIHKMVLLGGFFGSWLPQILPDFAKIFLPEVVFKDTQTVFEELWKNSSFYRNERYPKFAGLFKLWPPFSPWRRPKPKKANIFRTKIQPSGYPNMQTARPYLLSPSNEK